MPTPIPPADADYLRETLRELDYTPDGLVAAVGTAESPFLGGEILARLRYETSAPTPLNLLIRLFALGDEVEEASFRSALPPRLAEICLAAGMLASGSGRLAPRVTLRFVGDFIVAIDPRGAFAMKDFVPGVSPAAKVLLDASIRRPVRRTLDLGTGCGVLALFAAAHSERVVATDLNPRATAFTAFNARLNGLDNVEVRTGDLFAPVEGETFDLIFTNPPFAITPELRHTFYGTDNELDSFCRRIVREAPAYLEEGGILQMLLDWVEVEGEAWTDRLAGWFEGTGCEGWVLPTTTVSPATYVSMRRREGIFETESEEAAAADHARWRKYFESRGVVAFHGGFLALRRGASASGAPWIEARTSPPDEPWGEAIEAAFAARAFLREHAEDEGLLGSRPRLAGGLRIEQHLRSEDGAWRPDALLLGQTTGLRRKILTESAIVSVASELDGRRTVAEALAAAAGTIDTVARENDVSPGQVREEIVRMLRRLIETGFVLPPEE